jgi:hypothetical protein
MPTPKQTKLIELIVKNLGDVKQRKTLGELMLEAGYSKSQSESPSHILDSEVVQEGISDFISSLNDKRKQALTHLTEAKLKKAPAREVAYVIDILTKNHNLLNGNETERVGIKIEVAEAIAKKNDLNTQSE